MRARPLRPMAAAASGSSARRTSADSSDEASPGRTVRPTPVRVAYSPAHVPSATTMGSAHAIASIILTGKSVRTFPSVTS
jgi:hypothetical protein